MADKCTPWIREEIKEEDGGISYYLLDKNGHHIGFIHDGHDELSADEISNSILEAINEKFKDE